MFTFSFVAEKPEQVELIEERNMLVTARAAAFDGFPRRKYHSVIEPWGVTQRRLQEIAPSFETVVFGLYSEQAMARVLCKEFHPTFPGTAVVGVHDETVLIGVPRGEKIAINPKERLWDSHALAGRKIWLLPVDDPREQWLLYCDLSTRGVDVEHVVLSEKAWNQQGVLSGTTLVRSKLNRVSVEWPKMNIYALGVFWGLEQVRRNAA